MSAYTHPVPRAIPEARRHLVWFAVVCAVAFLVPYLARLISIPTFATANPVGSVAAHDSQHVAAVTHAYESRIFNPTQTKS
jgi:hypothetical protein